MQTAERQPIRSRVCTVPFGTDLCDATVRMIMAGGDPLSASQAILFVPNNRAVKAMTEAFVRAAAPGLLLPRMVAIGDLSLDEALGPMLDPLAEDEPVLPVIGPTQRLTLLAGLVTKYRTQGVTPAEALRLSAKLAEMIDELEIEEVGFDHFDDITDSGDLAEHWQSAYGQLRTILPAYRAEMKRRQLLGPSERRNILLDRLAMRLRDTPPLVPVIAAGITTSAKAVARVLRSIAHLPDGAVILPGVDLDMPEPVWQMLGPHERIEGELRPRRNHETHPQFHLKLLLHRMGILRSEVETIATASAIEQAHSISDIFCLPPDTADWRDLPPRRKQMPHIALLEASDSAEEARAIAIRARGALEMAGQRIAIITPDRELAVRVTAQLRRWNIQVDDSAGTPLLQTPNGSLIMALAEAASDNFSPVSVLAIAKHPLAHAGEGRLAWLEQARALDMLLRGPSSGIGLDAITARVKLKADKDAILQDWWADFAAIVSPIRTASGGTFSDIMDAVQSVAGALTQGNIWKGTTGRQLAALWEEMAACDLSFIGRVDNNAVPAIFSELFGRAVVHPPYGGHPRIAIYGLLEARMQQADIVICGGLNEGSWPQIAQPDPWLAPAIRRHLGLATLDRNIGLSAHDLSTALGAKEVILSRAKRDRSGPTVASRFVLRIQAYLGQSFANDPDTIDMARRIDRPENFIHIEPPNPSPNAAQRRVDMRITDFDRLKADPYAFYADKILRLRPLDAVDAMPDHAWRGSAIHKILEEWAVHDKLDPDKLIKRAEDLLANPSLHPALRTLWQPRISAALRWVADETLAVKINERRSMAVAEEDGELVLDGVKISGRVDRIDRLADGSLAIVDYKKGIPPTNTQIVAGFALQLGLLGLMADANGFRTARGKAALFEYWSLAKNKSGGFGYIQKPVSGKKGAPADAASFMAEARRFACEAIARWINGNEAFVAKLHPKYAIYADYDQLMRLQEWDGRTLNETAELP